MKSMTLTTIFFALSLQISSSENRTLISIDAVSIKRLLETTLGQKQAEVDELRMKLALINRYPDFNEKLKNISVSSAEAYSVLGNPARVFEGAIILPHGPKDKLVGYRVEAIDPTHIFFILGLRGGDIIKRIENKPIATSEQEDLFAIWKKTRKVLAGEEPGKIAVEIERNGKNIQIYVESVRKSD